MRSKTERNRTIILKGKLDTDILRSILLHLTLFLTFSFISQSSLLEQDCILQEKEA